MANITNINWLDALSVAYGGIFPSNNHRWQAKITLEPATPEATYITENTLLPTTSGTNSVVLYDVRRRVPLLATETTILTGFRYDEILDNTDRRGIKIHNGAVALTVGDNFSYVDTKGRPRLHKIISFGTGSEALNAEIYPPLPGVAPSPSGVSGEGVDIVVNRAHVPFQIDFDLVTTTFAKVGNEWMASLYISGFET